MIPFDHYILGDGALHDRFRATTEILGRLVSRAPRPVSIAQLESDTGRPAAELLKLCNSLQRAALLQQHENRQDAWRLACLPSVVTLEDVFRCVLMEQSERSKRGVRDRASSRQCSHYGADLLVTQATMAINQSVLKHLRQFSLDRLKISAIGKPEWLGFKMG